MADSSKPLKYRLALDDMVAMCQFGQGQIGANRIRSGTWNRNASESNLPEQHQINLLLNKLSDDERGALAAAMSKEVELGVFETLKILEGHEIPPFESGYEGSSFEDFAGRLQGWQWPE